MAAVTVKHIVDIVAAILQDESTTESERAWSEQELVDYYGLVATDIVVKKPSANPVIESVRLASGIQHRIPAKGIKLIRVLYNMGTDGLTVGDAITPTTVAIMELFDASWNQATAASAIIHFMPDQEDPTLWYSYPPSDGNGYVMEEFSKVPNKITWDNEGVWESAHIGVQDGYEIPLIEGMCAMAYAKDSDIPGNSVLEASHKTKYLQGLAT